MLNCLLGLIGGFSAGLMLTWLYLARESLRRTRELEEEKAAQIRAHRKPEAPPEEVKVEEKPAPPPEEVAEEVVAYCVRCRAKRVMLNPLRVILKNERPAIKGTCPVCGGSMFRLTKA
ncbi:MAG: DUF5679 domain-containing protein [Anaerolineae bacterium]